MLENKKLPSIVQNLFLNFQEHGNEMKLRGQSLKIVVNSLKNRETKLVFI
jgi:hypothetical protein